ncbi:MAG: hypothetical protein IAE80_11070 [Anaerolinea sp.]|nr:hypothetical protein [Anaerolinea sp.]
MTYEIFFPEHRHLLTSTVIRRERTLPEVGGKVEVNPMTRITLNDVVARGTKPAPYVVIDGQRYFKLRRANDLKALMEVQPGDRIEQGQTLAIRPRGKRLLSPISGSVIYVGEGRIILQETAEVVEVEAGLNGMVIEVEQGRGVTIEAYGGVLQGMWGNNRRVIGTLRMEPDEGMENIYRDAMDIELRGAIVVTKRPLRKLSFQVMGDQGFIGLIAPSMSVDLIEDAMRAPGAILLTEGFGDRRMSASYTAFLEDMKGRQGTLDAVLPAPLQPRLPEVVINVPLNPGERPPAPNLTHPLRRGDSVRLMSGAVGRVIDLPKTPVVLDNGLRTMGAQVELATGEKVTVPLANIDYLG